MLSCIRWYRAGGSGVSKFQLLPHYKLKCGLEIHTQLNTKDKLFSLSKNDPFYSSHTPNLHTSYFDIALPGTQPILNYEAVLYAVRLSLALNANVNLNSQFDRKHYFYGDQPMGYQITQHYSPFASGGHISLYKDIDNIDDKEKRINLIQLQIEQDTGKSIYRESENLALIDLNRCNVPLIEMVTQPDFTDLKQVKSFIKKYQNLVRHLDISTGDLETGAMRVDVNLSVNDYARIELKNLPNTSSIMNAIMFEYQRQVKILEEGKGDCLLSQSETRGWNGEATVKLRSKETTIDYRYMPDPELPMISLSHNLIDGVANSLPPAPHEILEKIMAAPYCLSLKDAKIMTVSSNSQDEIYSHEQLLKFYLATFKCYSKMVEEIGEKVQYKLPANWLLHELLGDLNKLAIPLDRLVTILTAEKFSEFLMLIHKKEISSASGKLLLFHVLENFKNNALDNQKSLNFKQLVKEYELETIHEINETELKEICQGIIDGINNPKLINDIITGKKRSSLKFLVGQGMRLSQGRIQAKEFEKMFKEVLCIES